MSLFGVFIIENWHEAFRDDITLSSTPEQTNTGMNLKDPSNVPQTKKCPGSEEPGHECQI